MDSLAAPLTTQEAADHAFDDAIKWAEAAIVAKSVVPATTTMTRTGYEMGAVVGTAEAALHALEMVKPVGVDMLRLLDEARGAYLKAHPRCEECGYPIDRQKLTEEFSRREIRSIAERCANSATVCSVACLDVGFLRVHKAIETERANDRANRLADANGILEARVNELHVENSKLRRDVERLERLVKAKR